LIVWNWTPNKWNCEFELSVVAWRFITGCLDDMRSQRYNNHGIFIKGHNLSLEYFMSLIRVFRSIWYIKILMGKLESFDSFEG
jgi:hypothetical protein